MRFDYLRGFRRLGWLLVGLSVPVVGFLSYQDAYEFSGFSKQRIGELYPRISGLDAQGPDSFIPDLTPDEAVLVLEAERNGTIEPHRREILAELRRRNEFPHDWEVEMKRLNWIKFGLTVA